MKRGKRLLLLIRPMFYPHPLWREVVMKYRIYEVSLNHLYVDTYMQLVRNPCQFDVVLCDNMFGDILLMRPL